MKKLGLLLAAALVLLLAGGCASERRIALVDPDGQPMANCLVFAQQENMLYPNSSDLLVSGSDGVVTVSRHGLVSFYAGKEGYFISWFQLTGKADVRVVIHPLKEKVLTGGPRRLSAPPEMVLQVDKADPAAERWLRYAASASVVAISPQELKHTGGPGK